MIILLIIMLVTSCSKSEVINLPQTRGIDTTYTPRTKTQDSTKVKIDFKVTVTPWSEVEI